MNAPVVNAMAFDHALKIVQAINGRAFLVMGLAEDLQGLASLADVSLAEMIQAVQIVRAENDRRSAGGGRYTINVVPDDRLIAAVYVVEHYQPTGEPIVASIVDGREQLLAVLHPSRGAEGDDE